MTKIVFRERDAKVVDRGHGVRSIPLINGANGGVNLTSGMTIMQPNAGLPMHYHDSEECITCVEGQAMCSVDGEVVRLEPFDHIWIAEGSHHRFWNEGDVPMRIMWAYGKPEVQRTFVDSGKTVVHMSKDDVSATR